MGGEGIGWRPEREEPGVRIRDFEGCSRITIDFYYRGARCRECLSHDVTPANYRYAVRLRGEIMNAIERKTFNYAEYFPNSKRALLFGHGVSRDTVGQRLDVYLKACEALVARGKMSQSTLDGYRKLVELKLRPAFGNIRLSELTPGHIRQFILEQDCTAKSIRNMLSPLRCMLDEAVEDRAIAANPIHGVALRKAIEKVAVESDYEVDPFDEAERKALLAACVNDEERDMYTFWLRTGLRPGELIALAWTKVDWIHRSARIDENFVAGVLKKPKTAAGIRDVELDDVALAALERQRLRTGMAGGRVWRTPRPFMESGKRPHEEQLAWESDEQIRRYSFYPILRRARVRHRNMYQLRHTFASVHCSSGANLFWLAGQMGHETIEMLIRHYGRWIPKAPEADGHVTVTQKVVQLKSRRRNK